ncbi:undecaprenyl-diphosphate phosphatase [Clostridium sp. NSJ-27]|uniref:Undecaprenyl-diphosphatase n=1 Tax=Clostridium facile TaxID=2763035 RepID=A0ABR7IPZ1_9CLOT|nr:undecaprenyl-diphosphate phosphatase [Clostridium facile]
MEENILSIIESFIQAIVQGLTEFLPVSSSGHLSLVQHFFGVNGESAVFFTILLHLGTLVAVFIAFRELIWKLIKEFFSMIKDIFTGKFSFKKMNPERNMIIMLIIALLPLIPVYFFKDFFTGVASDADIIVEGICFLYTATILFLSDRCGHGKKTIGQINTRNALTIGIFQCVALLPGVSRSGSTISAGLFCGLSRKTAVEFSFVLGIPAIIGGCLSEFGDLNAEGVASIGIAPMIIGFVVSAVVGFLAIKLVQWLINSDKFKIFAIYTAILGVIVLVLGIIEHVSGQTIMQMIA